MTASSALPIPGTNDVYTTKYNERAHGPMSNVWRGTGPGSTSDCDAEYAIVHRFTMSAAGAYTFTVSNPVDGRRLQFILLTGTAGAYTVTWPANFRFAGGVAPAMTGGNTYVIDFRYDSTLDQWVEISRSSTDVQPIPMSYLDTDGTLAANSDSKVASQKAVKTYADQLIASADAMVFKGVIDASANPNYPAADKGWTYRISVAGKIGGASGVNVEIGDLLLCLVDGSPSGNQATVGSNWSIAQTNVDGAVIGPTSATDGAIALFDGTTGKLIKNSTAALAKTFLGLGNVDNTSDAGKPISTAQAAGLKNVGDTWRRDFSGSTNPNVLNSGTWTSNLGNGGFPSAGSSSAVAWAASWYFDLVPGTWTIDITFVKGVNSGNVKIEYSTDGGSNWTSLTASLDLYNASNLGSIQSFTGIVLSDQKRLDLRITGLQTKNASSSAYYAVVTALTARRTA